MKHFFVGALVFLLAVPILAMEQLAIALREIALSGSESNDWNFKLSDIDVPAMGDSAIEPISTNFSTNGGTIKTIYQTMANQSKKIGTVFPLSECHCSAFSRSSILGPSVRTSYEQFVIKKLTKCAKAYGDPVAYVSVGSGGLLTDFSILDQFLDKMPTASVILHAVDTMYKHYLMLLDFCKGQPFLTDKSVAHAQVTNFSLPDAPWKEVKLGWSLDNVSSTINSTKPSLNQTLNDQVIKKFVVSHEQFQRFLYLLKNRHPKATVKLILWSSLGQFTQRVVSDDLGHIPYFIGSIDGLRKSSGPGAQKNTNYADTLEALYSMCERKWYDKIGVEDVSDNLIVGINDVMDLSEESFGGVKQMIPKPQSALLWIERFYSKMQPLEKEFAMNCKSEMKNIHPYGMTQTFTCELPQQYAKDAQKVIDTFT